MTSLRSITYVSTATRAMSTQDLDTLLSAARATNRIYEITGVLLFSGTQFMQCLEGPADAVEKTYARILGSSQHKDVRVIVDESIEKRVFGDWLMGSAKATNSDLLNLYTARWSQRSSEATAFADMSPGMKMLQAFWGTRPS